MRANRMRSPRKNWFEPATHSISGRSFRSVTAFIQSQSRIINFPLLQLAPHPHINLLMSSSDHHREEAQSTKDFTEHTSVVKEDDSVGSKVGQGVSYVVVPCLHDFASLNRCVISGAMKVIHGMGPRPNLCIVCFFLKFDALVRDWRNHSGICHRHC